MKCFDCDTKDLRIKDLEWENRALKAEVDMLNNLSFFSWLGWYLFGSRLQVRKSSSFYESD